MHSNIGIHGAVTALAIACGSMVPGAPAQAQPTEQQRGQVLEEVVVTAERRTESLQTSALSATVLDAEMMAKKSVFGLTSVQYAAPGVQIADYSSANTFNIRGVGQSRVDIDLPSGVVIYRDGVPTLTGYFQNAPYYDMASIEVLRGPQGTFAGKAASAGAVFIRTRDPELGDFNGSVMLGVGNKGFGEATLVLNAPIGETLAVRFSGHYENRESLFDDISTNPLPGGQNAAGPYVGDDTRDLRSVRLGVLWEPTDQFSAMFKVDHDHLNFGNHATTGLDPATAEVEDIRHPIVNGDHRYRDTGERASLKLSYDFAGGTQLVSLTGYSTVYTRANWDINGSDPAPFGFRSAGEFMNLSQEIDILSPSDQRLRWVAGAFWQKYLNDIPDYTGLGIGFDLDNGSRPDYTSPWKKDETSWAVFGQLDFDLTEQLELQVGVRYNEYRFSQFTNFMIDFVSFITSGDPNGTGIGIETDLFPLEGGGAGHTQLFSETSTDWKVNLNYEHDENNFFYALISRGHTPGSINFADPDFFATPDHDDYDEMYVINYEAGWKAAFSDQQVRTQFNVYYQVFTDYQADFALTGPDALPGSTLFQFQNALTDSTIYGAEFSAQAQVGDLEFDVGLAYSKSELGSFGIILDPFAPIYGGPSEVDLDGARTPFAPEWTGNVGVGYTFVLATEGIEGQPITMTPRVDYGYRDDSYARLFQNPATLLDGYGLVNAAVRFEGGPWSLDVWVNNLTDKEYVAAKQNIDTGGPSATIPYTHFTGIVYGGLRRLWGVRLTREF